MSKTKTAALESAKKRVTARVGQADVRVLDNIWLKRMEQGVIVDLVIRRWRARTRLGFDDLGVPILDEGEKSVLEDLLSLGEKFLMPASIVKMMDSIESGARKFLAREAIPTAYGAFVPFTEYGEIKAELDKRKTTYLAEGAKIADNLDEIKVVHLRNCAEAARAAYARLCRLTPRFKNSRDYIDELTFVQGFVDRIEELIPDREKVRKSYGFDIRISFIPLPSLIAKDLASAEKIRMQSLAEGEIIRAEAQAKQAVTTAERDRRLYEEELERLRVEGEIDFERQAIADREAKIEAMNRDVVESARKDAEETLAQFRNDLQRQLYGLVYDAITDIMASNSDKTAPHGRSHWQLQNLLEKVGKLNFFGNEEIGAMLKRAQLVLESRAGSGGDISMEDIQERLRDIAISTRSVLLDLGDQPRSRRELEIPDFPGEMAVRKSRLALGLPEVTVEDLGERVVRRL